MHIIFYIMLYNIKYILNVLCINIYYMYHIYVFYIYLYLHLEDTLFLLNIEAAVGFNS